MLCHWFSQWGGGFPMKIEKNSGKTGKGFKGCFSVFYSLHHTDILDVIIGQYAQTAQRLKYLICFVFIAGRL